MYRLFIYGIILLKTINFCYSQKFDKNWLIGYKENVTSQTYNGTLLEFNNDTMHVISQIRKMSFDCDNLSMSDSSGNLIFYSNGFSIDGPDLETLENGDDLNYCKSIGCSVTGFGLLNYQGIICLPFKGNKYSILHNSVKFLVKKMYLIHLV